MEWQVYHWDSSTLWWRIENVECLSYKPTKDSLENWLVPNEVVQIYERSPCWLFLVRSWQGVNYLFCGFDQAKNPLNLHLLYQTMESWPGNMKTQHLGYFLPYVGFLPPNILSYYHYSEKNIAHLFCKQSFYPVIRIFDRYYHTGQIEKSNAFRRQI